MSHMIQIRPSGIRVSRLDKIPALVAIAQIPIIGPWRRRITTREAARAQSFDDTFRLHEKDSVAFRQVGNSVNVKIVRKIMINIEAINELSCDSNIEGGKILERTSILSTGNNE